MYLNVPKVYSIIQEMNSRRECTSFEPLRLTTEMYTSSQRALPQRRELLGESLPWQCLPLALKCNFRREYHIKWNVIWRSIKSNKVCMDGAGMVDGLNKHRSPGVRVPCETKRKRLPAATSHFSAGIRSIEEENKKQPRQPITALMVPMR